jgi:copper oxidase (laccase) domain-containing protein
MVRAHPAKTSLKKGTAAVEARIVQISLQHHDLGAMRLLPLLKEENISSKAPCTSCNTQHYYSYRAEGESAGREVSIIMMGDGR